MNNFKNTSEWQTSYLLTQSLYKITASFPREYFGLSHKIRHACASIPAFLGEGYGSNKDVELKYYLHIAIDSAVELRYLLMHAFELDLFKNINYEQTRQNVEYVKELLTQSIERVIAGKLEKNYKELAFQPPRTQRTPSL